MVGLGGNLGTERAKRDDDVTRQDGPCAIESDLRAALDMRGAKPRPAKTATWLAASGDDNLVNEDVANPSRTLKPPLSMCWLRRYSIVSSNM